MNIPESFREEVAENEKGRIARSRLIESASAAWAGRFGGLVLQAGYGDRINFNLDDPFGIIIVGQ